ncbi:MAG TPA: helix-turn-helix domain-containing protein [Mucilaginibacter sp.]|jgi:AraC-like DNA-binding protein|nr:helix-turn-helix domain-containing protein [Mucilaginibacter sp.]
MGKPAHQPYMVNSVSQLHQLLSLPKPVHPLISVINLKDITPSGKESIVFNFYSIWQEKNVESKLRYGQNYFDFDEGSMIFLSPGQVVSSGNHKQTEYGWGLVFHPDFIRTYQLAKTIKGYGFFSYAINEALHLSESEEKILNGILENITNEYQSRIDDFSQDVIVAQIELMLHYCDRFYHRQFLTRKSINHDLLTQLEMILSDYFNGDKVNKTGLPTVQYLASILNLSPGYLSDMLRTLTGQSAQQHIHSKLIDKAKELISTTALSVSEIAYRLGFEHANSFSKLFKNKTKLSPLEYRQSFN